MVEMSAETFAFILRSDALNIDEKEILSAVKEWGTVNSVVTGQSVGEVLKGVVDHVRFPLLDSDTLHQLEAENEKTNIVPVRMGPALQRYSRCVDAPDRQGVEVQGDKQARGWRSTLPQARWHSGVVRANAW